MPRPLRRALLRAVVAGLGCAVALTVAGCEEQVPARLDDPATPMSSLAGSPGPSGTATAGAPPPVRSHVAPSDSFELREEQRAGSAPVSPGAGTGLSSAADSPGSPSAPSGGSAEPNRAETPGSSSTAEDDQSPGPTGPPPLRPAHPDGSGSGATRGPAGHASRPGRGGPPTAARPAPSPAPPPRPSDSGPGSAGGSAPGTPAGGGPAVGGGTGGAGGAGGTGVCGLAQTYGRWPADSDQARICRGVYGG
ncbi:hypothetical protein [Kitasatospora sp. NBC_01302]|uniref:hypothetical protein n=1 Tax=Kitasatospora sp. NBC_01302 TaxID=2903575 RepID=UPI002E143DE1|nr:hypothetical protein OG294_06220 [Kitasatospora sp. NBC_01302]